MRRTDLVMSRGRVVSKRRSEVSKARYYDTANPSPLRIRNEIANRVLAQNGSGGYMSYHEDDDGDDYYDAYEPFELPSPPRRASPSSPPSLPRRASPPSPPRRASPPSPPRRASPSSSPKGLAPRRSRREAKSSKDTSIYHYDKVTKSRRKR